MWNGFFWGQLWGIRLRGRTEFIIARGIDAGGSAAPSRFWSHNGSPEDLWIVCRCYVSLHMASDCEVLENCK